METRKTKFRVLHPKVRIQEKIQIKYEVRIQETWNWLKTETLTKETEVILMAVQDKILRINYIKNKVGKQIVTPLYRLSKEMEETM